MLIEVLFQSISHISQYLWCYFNTFKNNSFQRGRLVGIDPTFNVSPLKKSNGERSGDQWHRIIESIDQATHLSIRVPLLHNGEVLHHAEILADLQCMVEGYFYKCNNSRYISSLRLPGIKNGPITSPPKIPAHTFIFCVC